MDVDGRADVLGVARLRYQNLGGRFAERGELH
jgi:hypothetical protein